MAVPIISTKLHVPRLPVYLVPREHLVRKLEAGREGKLILVSAPAGFGKTSLVGEWAQRCKVNCLVSWVHLDENDNELDRFLSYIISALQSHRQVIGEAASFGLGSASPAPIENVLTSLVNDLDSLDGNVILILDDYHQINFAEVHSAVTFLIEHLPSHVTMVLATRADPPLPLHKLRAQGELMEVRAADLRFSLEDTRTLLEGVLKEQLAGEDIKALDRRAEGWVAGLQMIAISMKNKADIHEFVESFSGSHRFILDYLTEEIFNNQPVHIQEFLLLTSVLDRLCGPLCDEILSAVDRELVSKGDANPTELERANLFLQPLDDEKKWYRYHNLFADLLRQRLRQTWPEVIPGLMERAASWFAEGNYYDEAFNYALATEDFNFAADLIGIKALDLLKSGALPTLLGGLKKLPDEFILVRPWLCVYYGWALVLTGDLGEIERFLGAAEESSDSLEDERDLNGHIAAIRAYASLLGGDVQTASDQAQKAETLLPKDDLTARSVVAFVRGGVNVVRQNIPAAIEAMQAAGEMGELAGNIHLAVPAYSATGYMLLSQGDLAGAEVFYDRALNLATGKSGRHLPIAANVYSGMSQLYLARNDLTSARKAAEEGVELAGQWGNMDSLAGNYLSLAQINFMEGNPSEARSALDKVKQIAATHTLTPGIEERLVAIETQARMGDMYQGVLIEPLSDRELEVLRLMAEGRSNPEIAEQLVVALGTVKAHSSSIYRKLDVRSRTEAVIKAGELGLLKN
jgi:LuxR family maltose regulon positive regulatory protein